MPYIRRLPSGKWQATIRGPDGRKHTQTNALKKVVTAWAATEEAKVAEGRWRDPRAGQVRFADWATKWFAARVVEDETMRGDRGVYTNHIEPHWAEWRLTDVDQIAVQAWVKKMQRTGVGAHAIRRAYNLLTTIFTGAVRAKRLGESPCVGVNLPATPPKLPQFFTHDQMERICAELRGDHLLPTSRRPRYPGHAVMTRLMCWVGPRWGEAAGLCDIDVDWLRGRGRIIGALTQHGRWKSYPKTSQSRREVPIPADQVEDMSTLLAGRGAVTDCPCGRTDVQGRPVAHRHIFVTNRGARPLSGANWRVVWYAAIDAANRRGGAARPKLDAIPRLDPHDCRHTAASWLAEDGVPLYDIQRLLGHESHRTTQRYAHHAAGVYESVEKAWKNRVAHVWRTGRQQGRGSAG